MEFPIKISVVMPVYNTPVPFLEKAVESILDQTYRDFEFLIIDDGSTDECVPYLDSLNDERIRVIRNPENFGITKSLNIGFQAARGKYIARMDSDDISLPERFEKQLTFMESHPDVIVCGTKYKRIRRRLSHITIKIMESMEHYRVRMLFTNPGPLHPTAFFDHEKLLQHQITYDDSLTYAQDYDMWMKVSQIGRVCILPEILLQYRIHQKQISNEHFDEQMCCHKKTAKKLLTQLLGDVSDEELNLHIIWSSGFYPYALITPQTVIWYNRLLEANNQKKIYNQRLLQQYIEQIEIKLVFRSIHSDIPINEKVSLPFQYLSFPTFFLAILRRIKRRIEMW